MGRTPHANPSKSALYQRKWRAKQPKPESSPRKHSPIQLAREQLETLAGHKLGHKLHNITLYRERQKQRYRWNAVLAACRDLYFQGVLYSYADAVYRRDHPPVRKAPTPQAEYQRQYRAKLRARLPENLALTKLLLHLPEDLHSTLYDLIALVRSPTAQPAVEKPQTKVPQEAPITAPKPLTFEQELKAWEASTKPASLTLEEKAQAVLAAGHDLVFDGEVFYHEDAIWRRDNL